MEIPIRNIYYMLCYAWENTLKQEGEANLGNEAFDNIYNLLTALLVESVTSLIKSGLNKGYIHKSESLSLVRGKININNSIKEQSLIKKQIVCDYDEFLEDIIINRIIKSTIELLLTNSELDRKYKMKLKMLLRNFHNVESINVRNIHWSRIIYNRNNRKYRIIINICELINNGLIVREDKGRNRFLTFIKDRAMSKLYEKFILNFYKRELYDIKVNSSIIKWKLNEIPDDNILPVMKTDIELEAKNSKLIIDTKYYSETLIKSNHGDKRTLVSSDLYQIFAYIKNIDFSGRVSGMLLYPTISYDIHQDYNVSGNDIFIRTVNLGQEFSHIRDRLLSIVDVL